MRTRPKGSADLAQQALLDEAIVLCGLTVRFEQKTAINSVSTSIRRGEWVGMIGANGAGKTTLLRAIAQLEESTGSVYVGRKDMRTVSHRYRGRLVAYLPQVPELPADMPVIEYVLLGRTPHLGYFAMATVKDHRLCADLLERLGVQPAEDRRLGTLSGGELQRVVLARALAQETPVLLLDEPTSALDLGRRIDALALVDEARRERGLTVVSAMHDLTLAGQFSDRLVLISEGRIVLSGTPAEVLTEDALSRYFGGPVRVLRTDDGELVVAPRAHQRISRVGSGHQDLSSC